MYLVGKTKNPNQTKSKPVLYWHHSSFCVIGRQLKLATVAITERQNSGSELLLDNGDVGGGDPRYTSTTMLTI